MKRIPVQSTMIAAVGYEPQEQILEIEFLDNRQIYHYFDVPRKTYTALMKAESKGAYMQSFVIDQYYTVRLE